MTEILLSDDVKEYLGIEDFSLASNSVVMPCLLLALTDQTLLCVVGEDMPGIEEVFLFLYQSHLTNEKQGIPVDLQSITRTDRCVYIRFGYDIESLDNVFFEKLHTLINVQGWRELRKEERITFSKVLMEAMTLKVPHITAWTKAGKSIGIIQNLSYSGMRIFFNEDFKAYRDEPIIIEFYFSLPIETVGVKGRVLRICKHIIGEASIIDVAVKFEEPVNCVYQRHLTEWFRTFA